MKIDIVSDIVCPWCAVGYYQLAQAAQMLGIGLEVVWHPFELTPEMTQGGENLYEFIAKKFGNTIEEGNQTRAHLRALGERVGFTFNYTSDQIRYNTFRAHQLSHWAESFGKGNEVNLALFDANFSQHRDIDDPEVLADIAAQKGLNRLQALAIFRDEKLAQTVRKEEQYWRAKGIQSVPSFIFKNEYLVSGALGVERFKELLERWAN